MIKTRTRKAPGGQSIDASDYPERSVYTMRNVDALKRQAESASDVIGRYAAALLDSSLPWTRMRRVYALLGLVRRYGAAPVTDVCTIALAADMLDMLRLRRMLERGDAAAPPTPPARVTVRSSTNSHPARPRRACPHHHRRARRCRQTFLAHGLGHIACRRGATVLAVRTDQMLKTSSTRAPSQRQRRAAKARRRRPPGPR